jgi:CRP-like cAMP-binding protein
MRCKLRSELRPSSARILISVYYILLHMPIRIDRFDDVPADALDIQEGTQPYRILQFLAEHDDQAFTQTEIHEATGIKRGSVGAVLSRLEDRGLVRHKGRYWAIGEDDRLASYAAQTNASSASTTDDYYGDE